MKKQLHTFIMGGFALFAIYLYYLSAIPLPPQPTIKETPLINTQEEEKNALHYLNTLRIGAGLLPFYGHPKLNIAAKNHANYLTDYLTFGHKEEQNRKGFTGEFASSRVTYAGYAAPLVIENVSTHNQSYKESINGLFAAIYHRLAFLDFRSDTIGIGVSQHSKRKEQTAFVYDMSAIGLEKLYRENNSVESDKINTILNQNKKRNSKMVIYPFDQQKEVPPAFFDELPDPLPEHRVSGFPISISFNSFYHKEGKLLNFQLFDNHGTEITNTLKVDHKTDLNRRLEKLDFVLFPLERLKWDTQYHVKFLAVIDEKIVEKKWSFSTQRFNIPFHIVKNSDGLFKIKASQSHIFYFPPTSKIDLLHNIAYPSNINIEFIDKNTIKLTALYTINRKQKLSIGKHRLTLDIQK